MKRIFLSIMIFAHAVLTPLVGVFAYSEVIQDVRNNPIPIDFKKTIYIYYPYVNSEPESISDSQATITIVGDGFSFVTDDINDLYFSNQSTPVTCNSTSNAPMQPISADLINNNVLTYGLRSAKKNETGGANIAVLNSLESGCLRIGLQVNTLAKSGKEIQVTFNPNANNSNEYRNNPPNQSVYFIFGDAVNPNDIQNETNSKDVEIGFDSILDDSTNNPSSTTGSLSDIDQSELIRAINSINTPQTTSTFQQFLNNGWYVLIPLYLAITILIYSLSGRFKRITLWVSHTTKKLKT